MLNKIIRPIINHPIVKAVQKPVYSIRQSFLERRANQIKTTIQQEKDKNFPTQSKEKYEEMIEQKLDQLSQK